MLQNCTIAEDVTIKDNVIIGDNVTIEENVFIDYGCIIRDNVYIKKNSVIGARCILGEYLADFYLDRINRKHPLVIGENALIRSDTIIYGNNIIGDNFQTGHRATIRENSQIGNNVRVGTMSDIQGFCEIGNYVSIHSNVFIAQNSIIRDYAWLLPHVVLTDDPTPPSYKMIGVLIEEFAVICARAVILPGIHVGKDSVIGAGSVVTKDVLEGNVVVGNPAKVIKTIDQIKSSDNKNIYPWRYSFKRGMPWSDSDYDNWIKNFSSK